MSHTLVVAVMMKSGTWHAAAPVDFRPYSNRYFKFILGHPTELMQSPEYYKALATKPGRVRTVVVRAIIGSLHFAYVVNRWVRPQELNAGQASYITVPPGARIPRLHFDNEDTRFSILRISNTCPFCDAPSFRENLCVKHCFECGII